MRNENPTEQRTFFGIFHREIKTKPRQHIGRKQEHPWRAQTFARAAATPTLTLIQREPDHHQNLTSSCTSHTAPLKIHENSPKTVVILLTDRQRGKGREKQTLIGRGSN